MINDIFLWVAQLFHSIVPSCCLDEFHPADDLLQGNVFELVHHTLTFIMLSISPSTIAKGNSRSALILRINEKLVYCPTKRVGWPRTKCSPFKCLRRWEVEPWWSPCPVPSRWAHRWPAPRLLAAATLLESWGPCQELTARWGRVKVENHT